MNLRLESHAETEARLAALGQLDLERQRVTHNLATALERAPIEVVGLAELIKPGHDPRCAKARYNPAPFANLGRDTL